MNLLLIAIIAAAYLLGYLLGTRRGKAEGWVEAYFERIAADRARRNRLGQFKHKG